MFITLTALPSLRTGHRRPRPRIVPQGLGSMADRLWGTASGSNASVLSGCVGRPPDFGRISAGSVRCSNYPTPYNRAVGLLTINSSKPHHCRSLQGRKGLGRLSFANFINSGMINVSRPLVAQLVHDFTSST